MTDFINQWLFDPTVGKFVSAFVGVLIIYVIFRFVRRRVTQAIKDADARYRTRKLLGFLGFVVGVAFLGAVFSDQLGSLTVAFGVAGAGIAFALQEVIVSVAGWLAISFGNMFKTGDRVLLGGVRGDVIDIGVLRSTIMECGEWVKADQYSGRIVRIGNSAVFKEPVYNYSGDFPFLWDEIVVPVSHDSDATLARSVIVDIANAVLGDYAKRAGAGWGKVVKAYRIENASVDPMVTMTADQNWMEFTLRYIVDYKMRRSTKDQLWVRILDAFARTNGQVAMAGATLYVTTPPLDVNVSQARAG